MTYQQCAPMTFLFLLLFIFFALELRALGILVKVEGIPPSSECLLSSVKFYFYLG